MPTVRQARDGYLRATLARAEEAEAKYRSLVELLPAVTYVEALDSGRTLSVSPQIESIFGFTQEEWMGDANRWESRLHPDDRERVVAACDAANESRAPFREEYRVIARDGRVVWIRDEAELVRGSSGGPLCWQGVMTDITAERAAASETIDSVDRV
jgi:two-component system sensor histidine kinase UhpB